VNCLFVNGATRRLDDKISPELLNRLLRIDVGTDIEAMIEPLGRNTSAKQ
jgi:hypothetical protein